MSNRKKTTKKTHQNTVVAIHVARSSTSSLSRASCSGLSRALCVVSLACVVLLSCSRLCAREWRVRVSCSSLSPPFVVLETAAGHAVEDCCVALFVASFSHSEFPFARETRVRLGRVSPTLVVHALKKNPLFRHDRHGYGVRHGAAIGKPQRHRYLVAFFQNSATPFRHGVAMAAF